MLKKFTKNRNSLARLKEISSSVVNIPLWKLYLATAFISGTLLIIVIPPFQIPDEPMHYFRAQSIAHGELTCDDMKVKIEADELLLPTQMEVAEIAFRSDRSFNYSLLTKKYPPDNRIIAPDLEVSTCNASPLAYSVPATGLFLTNWSESELFSYYFARFLSLLFAVTLVTASVAIIPFAKKAVFFVGIVPVFLSQAGSFSYDSLALSATVLMVSLILYLRERSDVRLSHYLLLGFVSYLAMTAKYGYQPILLLLFLLYRRERGLKNNFVLSLFIGIISILIAITLYWTFTNSSAVTTHDPLIDPSKQLDYVLDHPTSFLLSLLRTYGPHYSSFTNGSFGVLGWLDYSIGPLGFFATNLLCLLTLFEAKKKKSFLSVIDHIIIILPAVISLLFISLAMYLNWTPVGEETILGIQGRYFLVLILLILISLSGLLQKERIVRWIEFKGRMLEHTFLLLVMLLIVKTIISSVFRYMI